MFDFWNLVRNENMKIYRRVRTWIMLGITLLLPTAIALIALAVEGSPSMWFYAMVQGQLMMMLITIFAVVVSADSVAGEFSTGTIKLLLIRPWSRSKILLSKYIALLLFALFFTVVLFAYTLLLNWAAMGPDNEFTFENPHGLGTFGYLVAFYGYHFIGLAVVVTMAFMISSVFRSGGLAIGLSIFILLSGNIITTIFLALDKPWVDYVLFLHLDLTQHLSGTPVVEGGSLGFSLGVLAVYYVIFIALSWYVFNKRDVAA